MSDLISRETILDKFKDLCDACGEDKKYKGVMCRSCYLDDAFRIVEDAPSAEPEERTAKVEDYGGCGGVLSVTSLSLKTMSSAPGVVQDWIGVSDVSAYQ